MSVSIHQVIGQIAEVQRLLADLTIQAASRLINAAVTQSTGLSNEEMGRRVAAARAALRGEAPPSVENRALSIEQKLLAENQAAGREITLGDSPAIEMHVSVNGQIIRAVLSDASFNKSRQDQGSYAQGLCGRLATREENRAVVDYLLAKEEHGTLNPAETRLLKIYRKKYVRDSQGGLFVKGRSVYGRRILFDFTNFARGALVVLPDGFARKVDDKTFVFYLAGPAKEQTQEAYMKEKLGDAAQVLIDGLKRISVDVSGKTPELNTGTLRTDSNNKVLSEQKKLYGGELVDAIQGVNLAIEAVCLARKAEIDLKTLEGETPEVTGVRIKKEAEQKGLDEGTATMLEKLTSGIIRVGSGALGVDDDGRLYADDSFDFSRPSYWAFGPDPAPKSKKA